MPISIVHTDNLLTLLNPLFQVNKNRNPLDNVFNIFIVQMLTFTISCVLLVLFSATKEGDIFFKLSENDEKNDIVSSY